MCSGCAEVDDHAHSAVPELHEVVNAISAERLDAGALLCCLHEIINQHLDRLVCGVEQHTRNSVRSMRHHAQVAHMVGARHNLHRSSA